MCFCSVRKTILILSAHVHLSTHSGVFLRCEKKLIGSISCVQNFSPCLYVHGASERISHPALQFAVHVIIFFPTAVFNHILAMNQMTMFFSQLILLNASRYRPAGDHTRQQELMKKKVQLINSQPWEPILIGRCESSQSRPLSAQN